MVTLVNILAGSLIYTVGIVYTIQRFAKRDRLVTTVVALLAPLLAAISFVRFVLLLARGRLVIDPCPPNLEEAESRVSKKYQQMFGGELRSPRLSATWKKVYERELQRDLDKVQTVALRYLAVA